MSSVGDLRKAFEQQGGGGAPVPSPMAAISPRGHLRTASRSSSALEPGKPPVPKHRPLLDGHGHTMSLGRKSGSDAATRRVPPVPSTFIVLPGVFFIFFLSSCVISRLVLHETRLDNAQTLTDRLDLRRKRTLRKEAEKRCWSARFLICKSSSFSWWSAWLRMRSMPMTKAELPTLGALAQ